MAGPSAYTGGAQNDGGISVERISQNAGENNTEIGTNLGELFEQAGVTKKEFSFKEEATLTDKESSYLHRATNTLFNDFLEITKANKYADIRGIKNAINTFVEASRSDLGAAERRYDYPEYSGNGIDLTEAEKYNENVVRNANSIAMGRQSVSPAILNLHKQLGGRVYDEGPIFTGDRRNEPGDFIRRGNFEGTLNNADLAENRNTNVKEGIGEKTGRQVQALQNEQISKEDAQISWPESRIAKGSV